MKFSHISYSKLLYKFGQDFLDGQYCQSQYILCIPGKIENLHQPGELVAGLGSHVLVLGVVKGVQGQMLHL